MLRNDNLAKHWHSLSDEGKVEWLNRLHAVDIALTAAALGIEPEELDIHAQAANLHPVTVTVVDAAGMRDTEPGVQGPRFSHQHPRRAWRVAVFRD